MGVAEDLNAMLAHLKRVRQPYETEWQEIADLALPGASRGMRIGSGASAFDQVADQPSSRIGARRRFESLPMRMGSMLASGMESLATPQGETWHGYETDNMFGGEPQDEETQYFERLTSYSFAARYDARSGFAVANQKAIRNAVFFGTGLMMTEENVSGGPELPCLYRHIPLSQAFCGVDVRGEADTVFRVVQLEARQIMQIPAYAKGASEQVKSAASNPQRANELFEIVHAVFPRAEAGSARNAFRNSAFASFTIETASKAMLEERGYDEFPYSVYWWEQAEQGAYGEGAIGLAIDDIRSLNFARKQGGISVSMALRPPVAVAHDGVMMRPNLNPGAFNHAGIDQNGRPRIQPLLPPPDIGAIQAIVEDERRQLQSALYSDLFATLAQNPEMTATEALIRQNEKGDLLGPVGTRIQAALARMNDREIGIYGRLGAFEPGSALEPPDQLAGRRFSVKWTSPLDRLRRAKEVIGTQRLIEFAVPVLTNERALSSRFDIDAMLETARTGFGAPASLMLTDAEREAARRAAAAQEQAAMAAQAAPGVAKAARDGAEAAKTAAGVPGLADALGALQGQAA